jgi:hypothetical protein
MMSTKTTILLQSWETLSKYHPTEPIRPRPVRDDDGDSNNNRGWLFTILKSRVTFDSYR